MHKIVILFTDECLEDGHDPERQRAKMEELKEKVAMLHAKVFAYGPPGCYEYKDFFNELPSSLYTEVDFSIISPEAMKPILDQIRKTVTSSTKREAAQVRSNVQKDIYGIRQEPFFDIVYL